MNKNVKAYTQGEIGKVKVVKDFLPSPDKLPSRGPSVKTASSRYELPHFLKDRVTQKRYSRWLHRKAAAHVKRDRLRHPTEIAISDYKQRIHIAVCGSDGIDWYTGEFLAWEKISTYNNEDSKSGRSKYKAEFAMLPTVDHVWRSDGEYDFVICGMRTNDAKNDLSLQDFLKLCELVLSRHGGL